MRGLALAAAALLLVGPSALALGARVPGRPGTITVTAILDTTARFDGGRKGPSAGDIFEWKGLLYNKRRSRGPIGRVTGSCIATEPDYGTCFGVYDLPTGKLVTYGVSQFGSFFDGVVLGGTGEYEGVTGNIISNEIPGFRNRRQLYFAVTFPS